MCNAPGAVTPNTFKIKATKLKKRIRKKDMNVVFFNRITSSASINPGHIDYVPGLRFPKLNFNGTKENDFHDSQQKTNVRSKKGRI